MSAALRWDVAARDVPGIGRVAFVVPRITDDMPPQLKDAIACRRLATIEGHCPCGATLTLPNREARRRAVRAGVTLQLRMEHEPDCAATDDHIIAMIRADQ